MSSCCKYAVGTEKRSTPKRQLRMPLLLCILFFALPGDSSSAQRAEIHQSHSDSICADEHALHRNTLFCGFQVVVSEADGQQSRSGVRQVALKSAKTGTSQLVTPKKHLPLGVTRLENFMLWLDWTRTFNKCAIPLNHQRLHAALGMSASLHVPCRDAVAHAMLLQMFACTQ